MSVSRTAARVLAACLASGAVVGAAAVPALADGHGDGHDHWRARRAAVVLGEVRYGFGYDRSSRGLNAEWIEVQNTSRKAVNLRGFTLSDRDGNSYRFTYVRLEGGASVRVHTGFGYDTDRDVYQDKRHSVWDRRDTATLRDERGWVVDTVSWGDR